MLATLCNLVLPQVPSICDYFPVWESGNHSSREERRCVASIVNTLSSTQLAKRRGAEDGCGGEPGEGQHRRPSSTCSLYSRGADVPRVAFLPLTALNYFSSWHYKTPLAHLKTRERWRFLLKRQPVRNAGLSGTSQALGFGFTAATHDLPAS